MKSKLLTRLTALACTAALSLTLVPAARAAGTPASSRNINKQDYTTWSSPVTSYLYENGQGGVTRVEYTGGSVVVEDYDGAYALTGSRTIQPELPLWGGFFAGKDANFLIFGQNNPGEDNGREVIRVVKYSKDWQRQGQASLKGANTVAPFEAGSLRCDEYGGYLYIRTCHEMYRSPDGLNHQSNLTMAVKQSDMSITDAYYDVMNSSYGYISHSFNQFLIVDQAGKLVALDHGDAYPRGVAFCKYYADAGSGKFSGSDYSAWCSSGNMLDFAGSVGNNTTGGSVGGLEETADCYIMTYNYDGKGGTGPRDAYFHFMDKASGKSWSVKLTEGTPGVTTPVLAPKGLSGGFVLWNGKSGYAANDTLYYIEYDAKGQPSGSPGSIPTAKAPLSDCQPIWHGGKAVWYVTDNSAPVFYGLDSSGVTVLNGSGSAAPEEPSQPSAPGESAKPAVPEQPGTPEQSGKPGVPEQPSATKPEDMKPADTTAKPAAPANTSGKSNPFTDVPENAYYKDAVLWALEKGVTTGVTATEFRPAAACTRGQVVTFLWRAKGSPEPRTKTNPFQDVSSSSPFYKAILWAQENGITSGTTATTFHPGGTCTSGHVVTFLWRANGEPAASGTSSLASANPGRYYTDAVAWADAAGLLEGTGSSFVPSNQSPRADIVTYLYRDMGD